MFSPVKLFMFRSLIPSFFKRQSTPEQMSNAKSFVDSAIKQYKASLIFYLISWFVFSGRRFQQDILSLLQEGQGSVGFVQVEGWRARMDWNRWPPKYGRDSGLLERIDWRQVNFIIGQIPVQLCHTLISYSMQSILIFLDLFLVCSSMESFSAAEMILRMQRTMASLRKNCWRSGPSSLSVRLPICHCIDGSCE